MSLGRYIPVVIAVLLVAMPVAASGFFTVPVCAFCGIGGDTGASHITDGPVPLPATITETSVVIRLHPNGSATWTITNVVANDSYARSLRSSPEAKRSMRRIARRKLQRDDFEPPIDRVLPPTRGEAVSRFRIDSEIRGNRSVVHLRFTDPDAAIRTPGGGLVLTYFQDEQWARDHFVNTDRLSVRAPEGHTVRRAPTETFGGERTATISGRSVTWRGKTGSDFVLTSPHQFGEGLVVTTPAGSPGIQVFVTKAVANAQSPPVQERFIRTTLLPTFLIGLVLVVLIRPDVVAPEGRTEASLTETAAQSGLLVALGLAFAIGTVLPEAERGRFTITGFLQLPMGALLLYSGIATLHVARTGIASVRAALPAPLVSLSAFLLVHAAERGAPGIAVLSIGAAMGTGYLLGVSVALRRYYYPVAALLLAVALVGAIGEPAVWVFVLPLGGLGFLLGVAVANSPVWTAGTPPGES